MIEKIKSLFSRKKEIIQCEEASFETDPEISIEESVDEAEEAPDTTVIPDMHLNKSEEGLTSPPPLVTTVEWDSLYRNAQDGGANSVLASHVLKKSMELLSNGNDQVAVMVNVAKEVQKDTLELKSMTESINDISKASKMISINLAIEAARFSEQGGAFNVVAEEMRKLSDLIAEHTASVEKKLQLVQSRALANEKMCQEVSTLFFNTNKELVQFRNLMLRIEELSTNQSEKLKILEKKISGHH